MHPASTDWNEVTGIATGLLACVLAVAAIFAARYAKNALDTARADLKTAQDQLEGAQRPVGRARDRPDGRKEPRCA